MILGIFTLILVLARMIKLTSLVINAHVALSDVALVFLSIVPAFLEFGVPVAALLGVMLAFARLSGDSEIVVLRASGVHPLMIVKAVLITGIAMLGLGIIVSHYLRPIGNALLTKTLFKIASTKSISGLQAGVFNQLGALTIYAEKVDYQSGQLKRVMIDDRRNQDSRQVIFADHGTLNSDQQREIISFMLYDGSSHTSDINNSYNITSFNQNQFILTPTDLALEEQKTRGSRELLIPELITRIEELQAEQRELSLKLVASEDTTLAESAVSLNQTNSAKLEPSALKQAKLKEIKKSIWNHSYELMRKYSYPFAALIFALIGLPLGLQPSRSHRTWGPTLSTLLSLIVIVGFYGCLSLGITLSKSELVSVGLGAWIPNLIFAIIAILLLRQLVLERWQNSIQGLSQLLKSFQTLFRFTTKFKVKRIPN